MLLGVKKRVNKLVSVALVASLTVVGGLLGGCGSEQAAKGKQAKEVNIAIQPSAAFIPLFVAKEKGWIEEDLKDKGVKVNWNNFESGPPMNESLASGSSDLGVIGDVPIVSGIAAGQKNELVAITCQAPLSYAVLAGKNNQLSSPAEFKGKTIATVVGSTGHNLTQKFLTSGGLSINDVKLVNISAGDAEAVLVNGEADAVAIWEPNVTRLEENGTGRIISDGSKVGLLGVNGLVARAEFAKANPEVVSIIIKNYARGVKELANLDNDTLNKIAAYLSLKPEQVKKVIKKFNYTVLIDDKDIAGLNDTIKFLVNIGRLKEEYDIAKYVNRDYIKAANVDQYLK
ncbi:ABC transporter, substrate binding protein (aliphatic sulfonate) [Anaerovibrio sp. JC8]|uniref:aliphatic sulfonate ABC transporter substrate-binding protein n=1 Tax=Anaerovibrio sp. JC8 TaxID=1240085 RepID=UPI000A0C1F08|nr:aliphatic sulfonate ABC transporter substrate-binding protein [Anaerovibrio sp. JC8]ORT99128.1 ABC transporter, substrate binding protein (aliphatic sulfonate) [Anaerovibrio sp. JC8]